MADEGDQDKRPLWALSDDEKRLLLITFAGSLASIVAGAAMIGSAIAYAKWQAAKHPPGKLAPTLLAVAIVITLLCAPVGAFRLPSWVKCAIFIVVAALGGTALLWVVGVAAGIH